MATACIPQITLVPIRIRSALSWTASDPFRGDRSAEPGAKEAQNGLLRGLPARSRGSTPRGHNLDSIVKERGLFPGSKLTSL